MYPNNNMYNSSGITYEQTPQPTPQIIYIQQPAGEVKGLEKEAVGLLDGTRKIGKAYNTIAAIFLLIIGVITIGVGIYQLNNKPTYGDVIKGVEVKGTQYIENNEDVHMPYCKLIYANFEDQGETRSDIHTIRKNTMYKSCNENH